MVTDEEKETLLKIENDIIDVVAILDVAKDACKANQQTKLGGLVCDRVQHLPNSGHHVKPAGNMAVDHISQAGYC